MTTRVASNCARCCVCAVVMVFDGCPLPAKELTNDARRDLKAASLARGLELHDAGGAGDREMDAEAAKLFVAAVHVTVEMIKLAFDACKAKGVESLVAPNEADAQMTYMVNSGNCAAAITEVTI